MLTCAAGFEGVVDRALADDVPSLGRRAVESGLLVATAPGPGVARRLLDLDYLSGVHQVVAVATVRGGEPAAAVRALGRRMARPTGPGPLVRHRSFRLRILEAGQPVAVPPEPRRALEQAVQRWAGMPIDARGGGGEAWVAVRRGDDRVRLLLRLDRPGRRDTAKGALRPDVAGALVRVAAVGAEDCVLDPFAGSGAIPAARSRYPHRRIVASDDDEALVARLRHRARNGDLGPHAEVHRWTIGGRGTPPVRPGTVDVIVTDPPWGAYERRSEDELEALYQAVGRTFAEVLSPDGVVVASVADTAVYERGLAGHGLAVVDALPVLINGRKAKVVTARRR